MKHLMIKDKIIEVPLVNQHRDTEDISWAPKTCGICAIKMLMAFYNNKFRDLGVMQLVEEAILIDGFIEGIGWRHDSLVSVAQKHGVQLGFKKIFSRTLSEKNKDIKFIEGNILKDKPVIVSIFHKLNHSGGGHLVVINGVRRNGRRVEGYFVQDPDPNFRGNNYYLTKEEFLNNWRGGMIYFK